MPVAYITCYITVSVCVWVCVRVSVCVCAYSIYGEEQLINLYPGGGAKERIPMLSFKHFWYVSLAIWRKWICHGYDISFFNVLLWNILLIPINSAGL